MAKSENDGDGNGESDAMHAELDEREVQKLRSQFASVIDYLQRETPHKTELARAFHTLGVCAVHLAQVLESTPRLEITEEPDQD